MIPNHSILATVDPIRVTGSRVLVLFQLPATSDSGLVVLPVNIMRPPQSRALVIAVGPQAARRTPELIPGCTIVATPNTGAIIHWSGYHFRLIQHQDVLGILES